MPGLEVRVLGPMVVLRAGEPLSVGRSKLRDLLALLAAHSPDAVSADGIVDELWRGTAPPSARKVVQKHVSELRQLLGRPHIVSLAGGYALRDVSIDSAMFDTAFEQARSDEPRVRCERLTDALAMWRGQPYADVDLDGLEPVRARLDELRLAAIEQLNEARLSIGVLMPLIADLERLTIEHPLREGLWSQLIRALYASGRQSDALRAFQRLRTVLARELGIEPSGELRQLEQRILAQDPELGAASTGVLEVDPEGAHRRVMTIIAVALDDPAGDDPEDRARSTKAVHEQIREWCAAADGTIESSMGSRLLIAFGAPAHEDDADRGSAPRQTARHPAPDGEGVAGDRMGPRPIRPGTWRAHCRQCGRGGLLGTRRDTSWHGARRSFDDRRPFAAGRGPSFRRPRARAGDRG